MTAGRRFLYNFNSDGPKGWLRNAASKFHPALRGRLLRLVNRRAACKNLGLLTVVVPMFNVVEYLPTLLDSIVAQSYPHLEILLVDDGSTDATVAVARRYAKFDRRIRILELAHGGNGRARNLAVNHATGQFLAFADADDFVPRRSYQTMVECLSGSGSDFVVGGHSRIQGDRRLRVNLSDTLHSGRRVGISLPDMPEIIHDVFLWNKVYRSEFWRANVMPIPEDLLYEDQETTARAYIRAGSFDVIPDDVYQWRIRSDGSSITQSKHRIDNLRDRTQVIQDVTELVLNHAPESVQRQWFQRALGSDLIPYFELVPRQDNEYWELLRACAESVVRQSDPELIMHLDVYSRLLVWCAVAGNRADVETLVVDRSDKGSSYAMVSGGTSFFARPTVIGALETEIDQELLRVDPDHIKVRGGISRLRLNNTGGFDIDGYAFIEGLDHRRFPRTLSGCLLGKDGEEFPIQEFRAWTNEQIDIVSPDPSATHADCGFSISTHSTDDLVQLRLTVGHGFFSGSTVVNLPTDAPHVLSGPRVRSFRLDADHERIVVELELPVANPWGADGTQELCLATSRHTLNSLTLEVDHERGTAVAAFPLARDSWGYSTPAPPSGFYSLRTVKAAGAKRGQGSPISITLQDASALPSETNTRHAAVRAYRTESGQFAVRIGPPIAAKDRSRFGQETLRGRYRLGLERLENAVLFESFGGKSCTDSPRAISDAFHESGFDGTIYWSVVDHSVPVPAYAIPVVVGSPRWFRALETSSILVNNHNFPHFFKKKKGQRYVQTWHGTPLKKIGLDAPQHFISEGYRRLLVLEAKQWDLLLAQNEFSADRFPASFGYEGPIACLGYPRNDSLTNTGRQNREELRSMLGIKQSQHAVLYAPTWRDDVRTVSGENSMVSLIDFAAARKQLGDSVIFLVRGHHNVVDNRNLVSGGNVIDVSEYPEINDLFTASDSLITDYSSCMFDYSVTGKAIRLLVPDHSEYKQKRGFYLDLQSISPGPIYQDSASLVKSFTTIAETLPTSEPNYDSFRMRFAGDDLGNSSSRVLDLLREKEWI